jgi:chromosome segregation ATPase
MNAQDREYQAAQADLEEAERRVRQINDELSDAWTAVKSARARLRRAARNRTKQSA